MTGRLDTRKHEGASALDSRLFQTRQDRQQGVIVSPRATIAFTSPATMTDSANGLGSLKIGNPFRIMGSTVNDGVYVPTAVAAGSVTIATVAANPIGFKTQIAGPTIQVNQYDDCL